MPQHPVALVTGASSGFGRLTALTLARAGWRTFAGIRDIEGRNAEKAESLRDEAGDAPLSVLELDIADADSVTDACAALLLATGERVDLIVNNAGQAARGAIESFTEAEIKAHLEVNLYGAIRVNRALMPAMRARKSGLIVHVSSGGGVFVLPTLGLYSVGKYALEALAEAYRLEGAAHGIEACIIEPGSYHTELGQKVVFPVEDSREDLYPELASTWEAIIARAGERIAAHGPNDPQEVADYVLKLTKMPFGSRPMRTFLGTESEPFNAPITEFNQARRDFLEAFGLGAYKDRIT